MHYAGYLLLWSAPILAVCKTSRLSGTFTICLLMPGSGRIYWAAQEAHTRQQGLILPSMDCSHPCCSAQAHEVTWYILLEPGTSSSFQDVPGSSGGLCCIVGPDPSFYGAGLAGWGQEKNPHGMGIPPQWRRPQFGGSKMGVGGFVPPLLLWDRDRDLQGTRLSSQPC